MKRITIVDYGLCNLDSIRRAVEVCGARTDISDKPESMTSSDAIIIPGVGAFPDAMANLNKFGLVDALREQADSGKPLLGICLGMQLLAETGAEVRPCDGLGLIPGKVMKLQSTALSERIPHMGWNEVHHDLRCPLLRNIPSGKDFYFVHSYHLRCTHESDSAATTMFCGGFTSVVWHANVFGVQFHPEKSQKLGMQIIQNFLGI